jgi:[acyl-carrier-protein] S-malonyltransferase
MSARAFLFPGQGSQYVGMAADSFRGDPRFLALVALAESLVGRELRNLCLRGPEKLLARTDLLQPLLVAVSIGYHRQLADRGLAPDVVAGHSLGEISALAAAGVVGDETAVTLAAWRGKLMHEAAAQLDGGMLAVTTDRREEFLAWLAAAAPGEAVIASDNAPCQLVVAGRRLVLAQLAGRLSQAGLGRHRLLDVAGPWHGPWMGQARDRFAERIAAVPFAAPRVPILLSATGRPSVDPAEIRERVVESLAAPVRWREIMARLLEMKVDAVLEVGPGRVLSGLARQNGLPAATEIFAVGSLRGVETAASSAAAPAAS